MPRRFVNWARTVVSEPSEWHEPANDDAIAELVRRGKRVRVVGGAHSWSAIAAPEQVALTLDRGVVAIEDDRVTVRAGTRLHELNAALAERGKALPILGSIAEQAIGGLIATGTHGSSLVHGNLASFVERMRVVDGRGQVRDITDEGPRVHLGALGIVTEIVMRIVPAFRLAETIEPVAIGDMPAALATVAASAEYCKVWWMPHTADAYVFRYERTDEPASRGPSRQRWVDEKIMHRWLFPALLQVGRVPGMTQRISRMVARSFRRPRQVGPSTLMLSTPMPLRHRETEAAIPLDRAGEALDRIVRAVDREQLLVNMPVEIRFVRGDRSWMSPAYGVDTCQIGAYCCGPRTTPYFAAFWREMRQLGARPHWGKELDHDVAEVRELWPALAEFTALRDELDPGRTFASAFHTRTLGA